MDKQVPFDVMMTLLSNYHVGSMLNEDWDNTVVVIHHGCEWTHYTIETTAEHLIGVIIEHDNTHHGEADAVQPAG